MTKRQKAFLNLNKDGVVLENQDNRNAGEIQQAWPEFIPTEVAQIIKNEGH